MNKKEIHERCLISSRRFKDAESQIIQDLALALQHKVQYHFGCASMHEYVVKKLGLSDELAYIFLRVARKTIEVPQLGRALQKGEISVSKANRLTAVLKPGNQKHWLKLAGSVSKNQLERKIAEQAPLREKANWVHPQDEVKEKLRFTQARIQLQAGVSENTMMKIRRVQDLLCQQRSRPVSLEETLEAMAIFYVDRKDPLEKAKRQKIRGKISPQSPLPGQKNRSAAAKRRPIPAAVFHELMIKHQGRCAHSDEKGQRCLSRRWLHAHHLKPVSEGGADVLSNLILLCSGHHRAWHQKINLPDLRYHPPVSPVMLPALLR